MTIRLQCKQNAAKRFSLAGATSPQSGESFAKTLVLAAFFGLAAVLLSKGFLFSFHAIQSVREDLRANQAIMQKAESLRLPAGSHTPDASSALNAPKTSPAHLRTVTVTLSWTNCAGPKPVVRQRDFQARLGRNGAPKYIWGT